MDKDYSKKERYLDVLGIKESSMLIESQDENDKKGSSKKTKFAKHDKKMKKKIKILKKKIMLKIIYNGGQLGFLVNILNLLS